VNPYESPQVVTAAGLEGPSGGGATSVRHAIVAATTLAAVLMYLDRVCIGWILESDSFKHDIPLNAGQNAAIKQGFFWAYALAQVPAGWLAERFGKRVLMSVLILLWSAFTALTSFADGFTMLLIARLGCGLAQAGAYPIAGSLLSRWAHLSWRGVASSIVSLGGRLGGALAPLITAFLIVRSDDWRTAGWVYGGVGIAVALLFWLIFRERPEDHPRCNPAEIDYLAEGRVPQKPKPTQPFPIMAVLTDVSLWLMCAVQFLTNVGWAFIINTLPTYFKEVLKLSDDDNGMISTVTLFIGFLGLLTGGLVTDACWRWLGVRWGRLVPLVATRFLAAAMFALCITTENPWLLALLLGFMAFTNDAGIPAVWAWAQDVGGRQVAPIMGWANMWGNFGAALQPAIILAVNYYLDDNGDYHEAFLASAGAFAVAGVLSLGINAAKPVVAQDH